MDKIQFHFYIHINKQAMCIGVAAQSTLGGDIFAGKNVYEKLTKCLNFT